MQKNERVRFSNMISVDNMEPGVAQRMIAACDGSVGWYDQVRGISN